MALVVITIQYPKEEILKRFNYMILSGRLRLGMTPGLTLPPPPRMSRAFFYFPPELFPDPLCRPPTTV